MQSGKVKHYNEDKGYGFIDVDNQSEDVFFHISKWKLSQPPQVGQQIYFDSQRNDKNQLRATKVTATPNNQSSSTSGTKRHSSSQNQQNRQYRNQYQNQHKKNNPKKGILSTVFSLIILLAIAVYAFPNLKAKFFQDNDSANTTTQYTSTSSSSQPTTNTQSNTITGDPQVDQTIHLIQQGGPFPYPEKDGTTFYNREGKLPQKSRGYYKEYTVPTPGVSHRGARRIVTGGYPPEVYYLTVDHYETFKKLNVEAP
ncbi:ribonuclease domain-containing protein [Psychrobacter sp. I-STPA10]|uniref:ribonuclease domain-containing protein n=1 Tax=Psychrobacter sp. I-STPA10 TaxID=2585769 RepID=UPI001E4D9142|nr:ribonuclease domain-containing protein [Psychrobacter sp. I-STPA10]